MIYELIEWDGKGSGQSSIVSNDKAKVMRNRECTLTIEQAKKKYGPRHFFGSDVKCSTVQTYSSEKAYRENRVKSNKSYF